MPTRFSDDARLIATAILLQFNEISQRDQEEAAEIVLSLEHHLTRALDDRAKPAYMRPRPEVSR